MLEVGYSHRAVALGRQAMVSSAHPAATLAGIETLKAGGTAADAAVAVNAVLAVTQPNWCGVGGDIFCLYYEAASRRVHFLDGAGRPGARGGVVRAAGGVGAPPPPRPPPPGTDPGGRGTADPPPREPVHSRFRA